MPVTGLQRLTREQRKQWMCGHHVPWEGTISRNTKFYLAATLADHPQLDKFTFTHGKFYYIFSNIGNIM